MRILNKIFYILLILVSFLLIGITSLFELGLGEGTLKDPIFYLTQLITDLALILVTMGTIYLIIDKFKETNKEYIDTDKFISDFAQDKRYIPSLVSKFLEHTNRKRKIKQHKFNLNKKLYLLINYRPWYWWIFPWRWGKKRYTDEDLHIWNFGTDEQKQNNDYCRKRLLIEEQLQEDIIEKTIDTTFVKYDRITESIILGGYYEKQSNKGPNEFVEQYLTFKIVKHKTPALLLSFGFTFLLSMVVVESLVFKTNALASLLVKVASLIWNAFIAIRYGKQLCDTTILKDIRFRKGLITEYDKWVIQEANKVKPQIEQKEELPDGTTSPIGITGKNT